jgi:hypothetical protein
MTERYVYRCELCGLITPNVEHTSDYEGELVLCQECAIDHFDGGYSQSEEEYGTTLNDVLKF